MIAKQGRMERAAWRGAMMLRASIMFAALLPAVFGAAAGKARAAESDCVFSLAASDLHEHGLASAASEFFAASLEANGCARKEAGAGDAGIRFEISIDRIETKKSINEKGMALGGGLSSIHISEAYATLSLKATQSGQTIFEETATARNKPDELFSGWRKARSEKKQAVENAAEALAAKFLKSRGGGEMVRRAPRTNGDFLNEDSDIWPVLGGGLTGTAIHEAGHFLAAYATGHDPELAGNKDRTFTVGPETSLGLSLLFTHRIGNDMFFPIPDVRYEFFPVGGPNGLEYRDENGALVGSGRKHAALIAQSGILFQNATNEWLLMKHPNLIDEDRPFEKGVFFINILLPSLYTVYGYEDPNSDLKQYQLAIDADRWEVNAMILSPAAIDLYRYYHPEKKKLRRYARIAKAIPLIVALTK